MTKIKAIVFDMDGVLIDAREWHYEALNRALALLGFSISRFDHLSTYDGLPTRRKLEMLSMERGLPRALHDFLSALKQEYTTQIVHTVCRPVFQHEYALSRLKADGYLLGVASNSVRRTVELMMERSDLTPYLSSVLSNEDVEHGKPHPAIYTLAMERLSVTPDETLVIEDNAHGVESAEAAGAHLAVVRSPMDVTYDLIVDRINSLEVGAR